ncbi:MAG: EamA family transporter [Bacteroidales bacterium]|nr:EamA family transporter [Bacteroidales bacterium]
MLRLIVLSVIQSFCLAAGQVFLKLAMNKMTAFSWTWNYFQNLLTNWWFLATGIAMGSATVLWLHILKQYPLSSAYPMTCMSFVFGMFAAMFLLHESIPFTRWIGVACIIIGVIFVAK